MMGLYMYDHLLNRAKGIEEIAAIVHVSLTMGRPGQSRKVRAREKIDNHDLLHEMRGAMLM